MSDFRDITASSSEVNHPIYRIKSVERVQPYSLRLCSGENGAKFKAVEEENRLIRRHRMPKST